VAKGAASERETLVLPADGNGAAPRLADGVELLGAYEGSGFKETPYVVRRGDGQVVQLPELLYLIAERVDGRRSYEEIASEVSRAFGRELGGGDVEYVLDEKLRPLGLIEGADGAVAEAPKVDPLLALRFRAAVIPERWVNAAAGALRPLFLPPVVVAVLGGLVALDVWLFGYHGIAQSTRSILYQPVLLVMVLGLVTLSAAFHELGHATACKYGGARPGAMGAGLYVVWPAFYTDVTDAYRLGRGGRLRTDLGGLYFNSIFMLGVVGAYFATGYEPLLLFIPVQHFQMMYQLLPFLRLDGYYVISDLTGVPDMLGRVGPTLKSLVPFRKADPRVAELKWWARIVVTAYVLTVVPILLLMFGVMVMAAPRIFATAWDSFFVHLDSARAAFGRGRTFHGVADSLQLVALALPAAGVAYSIGRTVLRLGRGAWNVTAERPALRVLAVAAGGVLAGFAAFLWWPNGEYRPIQPGERGTIQAGIAAFQQVPTGRPLLTPARQQQLGGAPPKRQHHAPTPTQPSGSTPTPTAPAPTSTSTSGSTVTAPTETTPTDTASTDTTATDTTATDTTPTDTTPTDTTATDTTATDTTPTDTTATDTTATTP
jgi:putative peptide zinc metalloprotease protein